MVFPENGEVLASQVSQETNKKGEKWFTDEEAEKMKEITWDAEGGFSTKDDDMLDEIEIDEFRVENMEDLDEMLASAGHSLGMSTISRRADDRSFHSHTTEIGRKKEDKEGSSQESGGKHQA